MKLKSKITLFSSLFMFVLIVSVNAIIYFMFYKIQTDNELHQLSEQTNIIVVTMKDNPDIPKKNLLQAFLPINGMIRMIDVDGKEMIPTLTKKEEYTQIKGVFHNQETKKIVKDDSGRSFAMVTKPMITGEGEVATLQVVNYLTGLEQTLRTLFYALIAASLVILIPTIIASNVLSRFILKPIKQLIATMKDNSSKDQWKQITISSRSHDELHEMETTFNDMIHHLRGNFERQEVFVSNASHELKTPISIMKSYAQLLKRRGKTHPEVFDEAVEAIDSEADRMEKLVAQMLLLAKRQEVVPKENVDLVALVSKVIPTFTKAYGRDIPFHAQNSNVFVWGNKDQLEQVMYILLDNAIKYSEQEIKVLVLKQGKSAIIQVTDFGKGISGADQQQIFDRFYRVDKARTRSTGGTGLGLSIANTITIFHDGHLSVESEIDQGTTFTVQLPIWSGE